VCCFDGAVVIQERIAENPEPVGHLQHDAVVAQRPDPQDALSGELSGQGELAQAGSKPGPEAGCFQGEVGLARLLEQFHGRDGVLEHIARLPLVGPHGTAAQQQPCPFAGTNRSAERHLYVLEAAGPFGGRRCRFGAPKERAHLPVARGSSTHRALSAFRAAGV